MLNELNNPTKIGKLKKIYRRTKTQFNIPTHNKKNQKKKTSTKKHEKKAKSTKIQKYKNRKNN